MLRTLQTFAWLIIAAWLLWPAAIVAQSGLELPAVPEDRSFFQDYANVIASVEARRTIGELQRVAFEEHDTPIMVVTIASMARYGGSEYSIERFAYEWFNKWQIGKRGKDGELINRGILLLVSDGDRKARIELGADWGSRFDRKAARIMSEQIVPRFKKGDFPGGVLEGVKALASMAEEGPQASESVVDRASSVLHSVSGNNMLTPLPTWGILALFGVGVLVVIASFFVEPARRNTVLLVGVAMMIAAVLLWVVLAIVAFLNRDKLGAASVSGGGFSSDGGFSSGGFSGGGGATGSW